MQPGRANLAVIAAMLLAALVVHVNAPRIAASRMIGGIASFAAVSTPIAHATIAARLASLDPTSPEAAALAETLADGRESLAVLTALPPFPGLVAPATITPRLEPLSKPPVIDGGAPSGWHATLFGSPATLALPPPPDPGPAHGLYVETVPDAACFAARAPPLHHATA